MGKYIESNLGRDEKVLESAEIHNIAIISYIIVGILFIWTIVVPIVALKSILQASSMELGFTNKRLMGKTGIINTHRVDSPLNKVDNISITQGFGGKIFGYGTIAVSSTSNKTMFQYIKSPEIFRSKLMEQIDEFDQERITKQAQEMAKAMQK